MKDAAYRGYRIRYHCTDVWFAHIYRPGFNLAMSDVIKATREEGEQVMLGRVHARIDQIIADLPAHDGSEPHE